MYHVKMAFTLIQVGANLWVNPIQIQGVALYSPVIGTNDDCQTVIYVDNPSGKICSDWSVERVRAALAPSAVSKAMESR